MLLTKIIKEWKVWRTVRKVVKQNEDKLWAVNFDHDWLGRLYTVVNIPDEIIDMPSKTRRDIVMQRMMIDNYIKDSLFDVTELLNELRLSDLIVYPDTYERFENTDSILLVLSPERRYTKPWKVITYLLCSGAVITGLVFLIKFLLNLF